jgi:hypothetical protein
MVLFVRYRYLVDARPNRALANHRKASSILTVSSYFQLHHPASSLLKFSSPFLYTYTIDVENVMPILAMTSVLSILADVDTTMGLQRDLFLNL